MDTLDEKPLQMGDDPFPCCIPGAGALAGRAYFSQYPELNQRNLEHLPIRALGWAVAAYVLALTMSSARHPFLAPILAATGGLLFGGGWVRFWRL